MKGEIYTYGIDPGLRHGSVVGTIWKLNDQGNLGIKRFGELYSWTKKDDVSIGEKSSLEAVKQLAQEIVDSILLEHPPSCPLLIAIDWDKTSVHWRGRKIQVVQLALLVGMIMGLLPNNAYFIGFSPREIRKELGLGKATKEEVIAFVTDLFSNFTEITYLNDQENDLVDAFILTYILVNSVKDYYYEPPVL